MDHLPSFAGRIAPAGLNQESAKAQPGFSFAPIGSKEDPAILTAVTLNHKDGLAERVIFVNSSEKTIAAYQIGWIIGTSPEDAKITLAPTFPIPQGLAPKAQQSVPPQPFPPALYRPGARAAFFVANIQFTDGTSWSADLKRIKDNALPSDSTVKEKDNPISKRL